MAKIAILVPVLGRPNNIDMISESLEESTTDYRLVFIASKSDTHVIDHLENNHHEYIVIKDHKYGDYARKINAGYKYTKEPLMFLGASDLIFHKGWLEKAESLLSDNIHVVGTNDLANYKVMAGAHSTHSLVTRTYVDKYGVIDEPGKVLCEEYWHEYVDDEFVETARKRNMFDMAMNSIVEHMHPIAGKAMWDGMYEQTYERMEMGQLIYESRKHLWT